MLNIKFIIENKEEVQRVCDAREKKFNVDELIEVYNKKNAMQKELDGQRQERNALAKSINELKKAGKDATDIIAKAGGASKKVKELEAAYPTLVTEYDKLMYALPNLLDPRVPIGNEDKVEFEGGVKPVFDFDAKTNWDLLTDLGVADFKRGIKVAGDRGWLLTANGARLNRAITNFLLDFWRDHGYLEHAPPIFVNEENLFITGHYPGGEEEVYRTEDGKAFVATAEIVFLGLYANETFAKKNLPFKIMGYTPCFRREAGTHKEDKGLYRTHQFDKVELVHITTPEKALVEYEELFENMKELYKTLELPYRMITLRANDMAGKATIERDMEVWLAAENRWAEVGSIGLTTDYQARRGNIRYEGDGKKEFTHIIYATGGVANRIMIGILNTFQKKDGTVLIPAVLQPYMGGMKELNNK